ncbi:hypothetical protein JMJ56_30405 [Belnapia sp. T18]|uniref:Uncharacterized protein n=1 Tax=Belnapia arida TaxID=2804533 RepID=A0ABS1UC82_9PROT|nr:hypothetical protein [Belnapia arida]MBL6082291.1 hypothetical protein [Belnapia arida]
MPLFAQIVGDLSSASAKTRRRMAYEVRLGRARSIARRAWIRLPQHSRACHNWPPAESERRNQYKADLLALPAGSPQPGEDTSHGIALSLLTTEVAEDVAALRARRLMGRLWQESVERRRSGTPLSGVYAIAAEMYADRLGTGESPSADELLAPLFP